MKPRAASHPSIRRSNATCNIPVLPQLALSLLALLVSACATNYAPAHDQAWFQGALDRSKIAVYEELEAAADPQYQTQYIRMPDGTRIAIDIWLPANYIGGRLPVILQQTRYYRSLCFRWPLGRLHQPKDFVKRFTNNGYAWVTADVRGTGASFGSWPYPWSTEEICDGASIIDWIVKQPWSNGKVGSTGISYDGTAAEFLATTGHPALKAIAPRFSLYDAYEDIAFPGGVHLSWFTKSWNDANQQLDQNNFVRRLGVVAQLALCGVRRTDEDAGGKQFAAALKEHENNGDVYQAALATTFKDDTALREIVKDQSGKPVNQPVSVWNFSPAAFPDKLRQSKIPVYGQSGWFDGGYAHSAIRRFHEIENPGSRLVIGPWVHGGAKNPSFDGVPAPRGFDHEFDLLRFFDQFLKASTAANEPPVHYFVMRSNVWRSAETFPPAGLEELQLRIGANSLLEKPAELSFQPSVERLNVDLEATSGTMSRWRGLYNLTRQPIGYLDRHEPVTPTNAWRSQPLVSSLELTGYPKLELWLSSSRGSMDLFAYLEDISPDGTVRYVTEGQRRTLHESMPVKMPADGAATTNSELSAFSGPCGSKWTPGSEHSSTFCRPYAASARPGERIKVAFWLHPTAIEIPAGHRLQLRIAFADKDNFSVENTITDKVELYVSPLQDSILRLPYAPRVRK